MGNNILAVGAHPDDVEMGCGGALLKHLMVGDEVFVLILTNGEKGKHSPGKSECLKSLKRIGIKSENIIFGNFRDGFVIDNFETVSFIENQIKKHGISKVYTHDPNDRHQDHRNTSYSVSSAARKVPEILLFQGPSTHSNFDPHYFIEISGRELNKKIWALKSYESQIKKGILNIPWLKSLAVVNGMKNNVLFAEGFSINHLLRRGKDV
jgi:LmbE family N-acetylglucosaminyl deacetylase